MQGGGSVGLAIDNAILGGRLFRSCLVRCIAVEMIDLRPILICPGSTEFWYRPSLLTYLKRNAPGEDPRGRWRFDYGLLTDGCWVSAGRGGQGRGVVWLVGDFGDQFGVADHAIGADHHDGAGQQAFQHAVDDLQAEIRAEGRAEG